MMARAFAEPLIFFTIPFALYVLFLLVQLIDPFTVERWRRGVVVPLVLSGLVLAVGSIVVVGFLAPRHEGDYVPAHIEDGRIVPGHIK